MVSKNTTGNYGQPGATQPAAMQRRIEKMARDGLSRNAIAKETGVGVSAVSGIIKRAGITFAARDTTQAAMEAIRAKFAQRRLIATDRALDRIEFLQDRLEAEQFRTTLKTTGGGESIEDLDFVPTVDERNIADTINRYANTIQRLDAMDTDRGVSDVKSMLGELGRLIRGD